MVLREERAVTDGWRLMGQETWLTDRDLRWCQWHPYRPDWDHGHCAFRYTQFFTAGYVTANDSYTSQLSSSTDAGIGMRG